MVSASPTSSLHLESIQSIILTSLRPQDSQSQSASAPTSTTTSLPTTHRQWPQQQPTSSSLQPTLPTPTTSHQHPDPPPTPCLSNKRKLSTSRTKQPTTFPKQAPSSPWTSSCQIKPSQAHHPNDRRCQASFANGDQSRLPRGGRWSHTTGSSSTGLWWVHTRVEVGAVEKCLYRSCRYTPDRRRVLVLPALVFGMRIEWIGLWSGVMAIQLFLCNQWSKVFKAISFISMFLSYQPHLNCRDFLATFCEQTILCGHSIDCKSPGKYFTRVALECVSLLR